MSKVVEKDLLMVEMMAELKAVILAVTTDHMKVEKSVL